MSWRDQLAKPTGAMGWIAGHMMSMKNGNSEWIFSLLDLKAGDRVLEIGYGSGVDVARACGTAAFVAGVDHSDVMHRQATKRNAAAIQAGRVDLQLGSASKLPYPDAHFDKIFAINSAQFWKDQAKTMVELARVLKPGGSVLLAVQPRSKNATEETTKQAGIGLSKSLGSAGFGDVHMELRDAKPAPTVCVLARK
jgi:ubiquinone/menaquinone biosynthesis C-methylase UbiE